MALYSPAISRLRSTTLAKRRSRLVASIHILDDDSLLNMFHFYRPVFLGEDEKDVNRLLGGMTWAQGRWWYRLTHVCHRWRNIILHSASYLRLSLVCTNGTPVEDMLAHSPPLPLTIDYTGEDGITAEDEEGIFLALEHRHRVRDLRLVFPVQNLNRLVTAIDEEFPILEHLIMYPPLNDNAPLRFPGTLQAPHLRHLTLRGFACAIRSELHPTAASLVTLCLTTIHPSAFFQPNILLQAISFMPQLESLEIAFQFPVRNRDLERHLTHTPITTHITLPNLHLFWFQGVSAYLEAVVCRITTPRLENLRIRLFNQLTFSLPHLGQFMNTTENLRFDYAVIMFKDKEIDAKIFSSESDTDAFGVTVDCSHLDWQISSVAQISNGLTQVLSAVEGLTLEHDVHSQSSEEHNDVDRIEWRNLLRSFNNVKILHVEAGLVEKLSHGLGLEDGEDPLEFLPELKELRYSRSRNTGDVFTSFIDSRQKAGRPVTAVSTMQFRREDLSHAKRWIAERKQMAFSSSPNFDRVAPIQSIPESDTQEYQRNLERLDQELINIERYIHIAFAATKKGEVVERLFKMMASAKSQLEELKKPKPQYVLELHTIRGMIQEADNMGKRLKTLVKKMQQPHVIMAHSGVPSAPQPPPQPPSASTSALFAQSVAPTTPPPTVPVSRPPHAPSLHSAHRKKPSQAQAISTPTPPPIPVASTPTPQAATPSITAPSPQTPKSPKGKAASVGTPTPAHTVVSTPTSSTPLNAKGGGKRTREDDTDAPTPGVTSLPSPKRVKPDWEGPPNE